MCFLFSCSFFFNFKAMSMLCTAARIKKSLNDVICSCNQGITTTTRYFKKWLTWGKVAQAPPPLSTAKEVVEKPNYISVTHKAPTTPKADSSHVENSRIQVSRAVTIAPYCKEAVTGRREKVPSESFKDRHITISVEGNEVATIIATRSANTTLAAGKSLG